MAILTGAKECAELAKKIWPSALIERGTTGVDVFVFDKPNETRSWHDFNPFTDRDSCAELITWLDSNNSQTDAWDLSLDTLLRIVGYSTGHSIKMALFYGLSATPEQIALAACAALGVEVEQSPPITPKPAP